MAILSPEAQFILESCLTINSSLRYFYSMKKIVILLSISVAVGLVIFLAAGCDTAPASESPEITPSSVIIKIGQSVQFTASGGYDYSWSLSNDGMGILSIRSGGSTIYTSTYDPPAGSTSSNAQVLTVTSRIAGSTTTTNSAAYVRTAEAFITHICSTN